VLFVLRILILASFTIIAAARAAEAPKCAEPGAGADCALPIDLGAAIGASRTIDGVLSPAGSTEWRYALIAEPGQTIVADFKRTGDSRGFAEIVLTRDPPADTAAITTQDNAYTGTLVVTGSDEVEASERAHYHETCVARVLGAVNANVASGPFTLAFTRKASEIRPIADMRIWLFGAETGRMRPLTEKDGYEGLNVTRDGREAADGFLVDVTLEAPPNARARGADFKLEVYAVARKANGDIVSTSIAKRRERDIMFGAGGIVHEALYVPGHLCGQIAIYASIEKPTFGGTKAMLPFECAP
jgi:hypothetical protein